MLRIRQDLAFAVALVACDLILTGCASSPVYAPPAQVAVASQDKHLMMAADPDSERLLVADIGPLEGGRFRWTRQRPAVRLELPQTAGLKLRARFWVAGAVLKAVGPLEISYLVNGKLAGRASYANEGEQIFEKPVDASWLHVGSNEIQMELDKVYQRGDAKLGVSLVELGLAD